MTERRSLSAGTYVIESAEDALSEDEERGIVEALEAVRNGHGVTHEAARDALVGRLTK